MTHEEMERLTAGTNIKSEKIRILFRAGLQRADIARFMGISYQHVQNVLKGSGLLGERGGTETKPSDGEPADDGRPDVMQVYTLTVGAGGKITLPPEYLAKQGISSGNILICREEAGGLLIMSRDAALEALREAARQRMPGEAALLEALLDQNSTS